MLEPIRKTLRDREMMRTIFALAGPTVMENALQTVVSYADTAQVGAIGAQASASVSKPAATRAGWRIYGTPDLSVWPWCAL